MKKIVSVKPLEDYKLDIVFKDGEKFVYDTTPDLWGEMFEPLKDKEYFRRVSVDESGSIFWPNGADYCGDALFLKMQEMKHPAGRASNK